MITDYIDHEEATIQSYMRDPEFAEYMLHSAIAEGDLVEAQKVQRRMLEAWRKTQDQHSAIFMDFAVQVAPASTPIMA